MLAGIFGWVLGALPPPPFVSFCEPGIFFRLETKKNIKNPRSPNKLKKELKIKQKNPIKGGF